MLEFLNIWYAITLIGAPQVWAGITVILIVIYFSIRKKIKMKNKLWLKNFLLLLIPILIVVFLGAEILKLVIQIPRVCIPCPAPDCNPYCSTSNSFPSGHTATISAVVVLICLLAKRKKYLLIFILPFLVGISRLMLGVHAPIDVIGGCALGTAVTILIWRIGKERIK